MIIANDIVIIIMKKAEIKRFDGKTLIYLGSAEFVYAHEGKTTHLSRANE